MYKRGQLPQKTVTIFLAVIGFLIVLVFILTYLDLQNWSEDEICAASILARATSPEEAQELFELKCTTKKICITFDSDCPQFLGIDKSDIHKIKLSNTRHEESARRIEQVNANAFYDCWKMTGEGKLAIFPNKVLSDFITNILISNVNSVKPKCLICSRVAISPDLTNPKTEKDKENARLILEKVDVHKYLEDENVPGSDLTYLETFTDRRVNAFPQEFKSKFGTPVPIKDKDGNVIGTREKKSTDQIAYIFSQVLVEDNTAWESALDAGVGTGITYTGGALLTPAGRVLSAATGFTGTAIGGIIASTVSGGVAYFQQANNIEIATSYCGSLTSTDEEARTGCSLVTPADYNDIDAINNLCSGGIEGSP